MFLSILANVEYFSKQLRYEVFLLKKEVDCLASSVATVEEVLSVIFFYKSQKSSRTFLVFLLVPFLYLAHSYFFFAFFFDKAYWNGYIPVITL